MTKVADDADDVRFDEPNHLAKRGGSGGKSVRDKLIYFSDDHLGFSDIPMPEVEIVAYYEWKGEKIGEVHTTMKLKRIMRYQHLSADIEDDYPQNQEYFLYSDDKVNIYHIDVRKCHLMVNGNNASERVHLALPQQVPRLPAAGAAGLHPAVRECAGRAGDPRICGHVSCYTQVQ